MTIEKNEICAKELPFWDSPYLFFYWKIQRAFFFLNVFP